MTVELSPLEQMRELAKKTTPKQIQAELHGLSKEHAVLVSDGTLWSLTFEDRLRAAIGMERKSQLEMRIALNIQDASYIRRTIPLGAMSLLNLCSEYKAGRTLTLKLLDVLLRTAQSSPIKAWTLGEEVPALVYAVALKSRLTKLAEWFSAENY